MLKGLLGTVKRVKKRKKKKSVRRAELFCGGVRGLGCSAFGVQVSYLRIQGLRLRHCGGGFRG
jgi:hypothetical protein